MQVSNDPAQPNRKPEPARRRISRGGLAIIGIGAVLALAACASAPEPPPSARVRDPQTGGVYKVGKPYAIKGVLYTPRVDYAYDETGTASWYGPGFHNQQTANGEIYDMNDLTAAHTTLPLPSIVRVTNLDNGRSLKLRLNDRGPFVNGRIIDVSRRASQLLGFYEAGTAPVRVEIVADESRQLAEALTRPAAEPAAAVVVAAAAPATDARAPALPAAAEPAPTQLPEPDSVALSPAALALLADAPPHTADRADPPAQAAEAGKAASAVADVDDGFSAEAIAPARGNQGDERRHGLIARRDETRTRAYVQAGAFADARNAAWARQRLAQLGSVEVRNASADGRGLFRVRLGPFASNTDAQRMLARVIGEGFSGSHVVYD